MATPLDFIHRLKSWNYILNKQYHVKVLLKRFHLNGNTTEFHPQILKLGDKLSCCNSVQAIRY